LTCHLREAEQIRQAELREERESSSSSDHSSDDERTLVAEDEGKDECVPNVLDDDLDDELIFPIDLSVNF
jgi:hypothetical protein